MTVLLETTAGQGTSLGSRFEELASILEHSRYPQRLGICVDTCHIFAAGYDIRTLPAYVQTMEEFDRQVGIGWIKFFHLNDSKQKLASRVDRHEHIGQGAIGLAGFRSLLNDPRFADHPMTLETPKGDDLQEDRDNLLVLRGLIEKPCERTRPGGPSVCFSAEQRRIAQAYNTGKLMNFLNSDELLDLLERQLLLTVSSGRRSPWRRENSGKSC